MLAIAFADGGSKTCVLRGLPLEIRWTEAGAVKVLDKGDVLVSVNVGELKGTTTLKCTGDNLQFLTDTHRLPGKITLEKVNVGLGPTLDTLDPARFAVAAAAPAPTPRPRPRPVAAAPPPEPEAPRHTGVAAAEACVNVQAWSDYAEGWRVRKITADLLPEGERRNHAVTLLGGNAYRFYGCAQSSVSDLELVVYDAKGRAVARDSTGDRQPIVDFVPPESGMYHVVLADSERGGDIGVAFGVVYRKP